MKSDAKSAGFYQKIYGHLATFQVRTKSLLNIHYINELKFYPGLIPLRLLSLFTNKIYHIKSSI